jgi:tetratricopeptide (TPR) repeat protein
METWHSLADETANALCDRKAVLFAGAGISIARQARLPGWLALVKGLIGAVAGPDGKEDVEYITDEKNNYNELLFNEIVLQRMRELLGLEAVAAALTMCLNTSRYSRSHRFFAWAMQRFSVPVLTTNFDELIELAGGDRACLIKLHGTLGDARNARFCADNIFSPLHPAIRRSVRSLFATGDRTLVVFGYGGQDEFDVIPALFGKPSARRILWIEHAPGEPTARAVERRLDALGSAAVLTKADTDAFLRRVYETARHATPSATDAELDDCSAPLDVNPWDWWRRRLDDWGAGLRSERAADTAFLWARILDHLRLYKLVLPSGEVRNPALTAFQRFLDMAPGSCPRGFEAKARVLVMRRTTGETTHDAFEPLINEIRLAINIAASAEEAAELRRLLNWTVHQHGVAMQGQALKLRDVALLRRALEEIERAAADRRDANDSEYHYSEFQRFILASYAEKTGLGTIDEFIPDWRLGLCQSLEKAAHAFRRRCEPEHSGTTWHNAAYIYQYRAGALRAEGHFDEARKLYVKALGRYRQGWVIRSRLRDFRMIAQSRHRIAECCVGLATIAFRGRHNKKRALQWIAQAELEATWVKDFYGRIPQEDHRKKDVENIWVEINRLRDEIQAARARGRTTSSDR